ncbi:tensin-1 isoform X4 [Coccinella septempunctata]|uniref:tensin-1 isoform X4 n=1 Tax=Coccinella septempunctata TaxID=41139 RepID=UPI001D06CF64|nr:tensin-1 isoform X4 [Coccinella septempunctata]
MANGHNKLFTPEELCKLEQEAVTRYTDTSWRLHRQTKKTSHRNSKNENKTNDRTVNEASTKENDTVDRSEITKECQTKNGCEDGMGRESSERESNSNFDNYAEIFTHTHEDTDRDGPEMHKIITSYNGFGEAFTSQPRPSKKNTNCESGTMDLSYVTERIIAIWFPADASSHSYRQGQRQASHMLRHKHGNNYMVFNLTEPKKVLKGEHKHVQEVGWSRDLAPPLENLCSICKEIETWLSADEHRIAVLHAKGNKDKLGVIVAAYMHYSSICGNAEQALDRFSMRKYLEENIGSISLPSNRRYVDYFAGLLSHNIRINTAPLYLTHVTVLGTPAYEQGGCKAFLKLYQGQLPVYTSGVYSVAKGVRQFTVNVAGDQRKGLQLRGDILIKCYHRSDSGREKIFACQFHTCAVTDYTLSFTRQELDVAYKDLRFPSDGAVELHFSQGSEVRHPAPAPTPAVPFCLADDSVIRAHSPMNLEDSDDEESDGEEVNHTFGPLDGSIYATVAKKPDLSPGAVSSPLTVSMDSGISSAGHQQNANTAASSSPPLTAQPSPLTPEDRHRELDELLSDMMLTVESIPDLKPLDQNPSSASHTFNLENVRFIDDEEESSRTIPYHARQDSRPFSYGVNSATMIQETQQKLSSPSLVRKASFDKSNGDTLKKVQTQVYPYDAKPIPSFSSNPSPNYATLNYKYSNTRVSPPQKEYNDPIDDIFTQSALSASNNQIKREFREEYYKDERRRYDPLKRSLTESTIRRSPEKIYAKTAAISNPYSDTDSLSPPGAFRTKSPEFHENYSITTNNSNLTWLQKQQLKLKEKKEQQLREERFPHESRLLSELRTMQSRRHHHTASVRMDGYTSDTTAFADDDDDYTVPLHINTRNHAPIQSSKIEMTESDKSYTTKQERPFVAVKKMYERNLGSSPHSRTNTNSLEAGLPRGDNESDSGLLSLVEQRKHFSQHINHHNDQNNAGRVGIEWDSNLAPDSTNNRIDALNILIDNLCAKIDEPNNTSPSNACQYREREETLNTWKMEPVYDSTSPSQMNGSSPTTRPQTPAFPVHVKTPSYSNTSNSTVQFDLRSERLPPKSPTTQRRLSYPMNTVHKKWSLSPSRKDIRPTSPVDVTDGPMAEYAQHHSVHRSVSATGYRSDTSDSHSPRSVPTTPHNGSTSPVTLYYGNSRRSSMNSNGEPPIEVAPANVKFVRDTSKFWYKPTISREDAINILRNQQPGAFIVRDSNSFPGAFGMAVRVATVPQNIQNKSTDKNDELIRHYLIEPTSRGVRLKGCPNEPVFTSLSALVYQHSITQMALPCKLVLPDRDLTNSELLGNPQQQLLTQGAACNVLYIFSMDMESLTGPQAVRKAVMSLMQKAPLPEAIIVHFKVNGQGITLTDNKRQMFFRKHYPINTISHCGIDPDEKQWTVTPNSSGVKSANRIFGFVARKPNVKTPDNQCHLFAELEPEQPASAIVNFVNKIMSTTGIKANMV